MFLTRTMSSIFLVLIAAVTIGLGGPVLAGTLFVISIIAFFELAKATGIHTADKKINGLEIVGILGITGYYAITFFHNGDTFIMLCLLLVLVALMFVYVFTFPKYHANQIMNTFFCVIYAPIMLSFIYLTRELEYGIYIVWMIFISSWICDTCAYLVGMLIGKHKMAPKLSPKKSVEGGIGGIVGAALIGGLYGYFIMAKVLDVREIPFLFALIAGIGAMISQVGDLAASAIKRNHEIKDYGKLIPGHGGIMDRFDSVIFTAPMIYFLVILLIQ